MSNIEEDIQILKIFNVKGNYLPDKINRIIEPEEVEAINHVLQKLEQDKKRIKELEEEKEELSENYNLLEKAYITDNIPKAVVKDKIEELRKEYEIALEENSTKAFILKCKISALEELLEEK